MGSLSGPLRQIKAAQFGSLRLARAAAASKRRWDEIERAVEGLNVVPGRTRVYQDGLPVCGREAAIVSELAVAGSRNHQLLLRLRERGAELMGTESAELLVQEYNLLIASMPTAAGRAARNARRPSEALGKALLESRDRFIAERINSTLGAGETGILFLGMLHLVLSFLAPDIQVVCPVPAHRTPEVT